MWDDLSVQLAKLVDSVLPVTADEARLRLSAVPPYVQSSQGRRRRRPLLLAISGAIAAAAAALLVVAPWAAQGPFRPYLLSPSALRLVAENSRAALNSGAAHIEIRTASKGSPGDPFEDNSWSVDMSFSGSDLTERVTATSASPPGPRPGWTAPPSTTTFSMAKINGIVYRQLDGKWYAESEEKAPNLLTVPTPRTIFKQISPSAQLASLGPDKATGLTHLVARNPQALAGVLDNQIVGLGDNTITSFDLWVDDHKAARRLAWTTSGQAGVCHDETSPSSIPMHCEYAPVATSVSMIFSNLGTGQSIEPPANALPGTGPFDGPGS